MAGQILFPHDADDLVTTGLASPVLSDGTRRIHRRLLNRLSDAENSHLPLTPVSSPEAATLDAYATVPEVIISRATLSYLGFKEEVAAHIWHKWTNWPAGDIVRETDDDISGMPFIEFITGYVNGRRANAVSEDDEEWHSCIEACGIGAEARNAIMDPVFKTIRLTESCVFWIRDTLEMRYRSLKAVQKASQEREFAIVRAQSLRSGHGSGTGSRGGNDSSTGGDSSRREKRRSISYIQQQILGIEKDTAMSPKVLAAQNIPGYTILYKGLDQARIEGLHDENGRVVALQKLWSRAPTDFHRGDSAYYFAMDREIAVRYANYAKHRNGVSSTVIVEMAIPNSAIESLSETELLRSYWPSSEWKELVFLSRNELKLTSELRRFRLATLIIGTISSKPTVVFQKLRSPEEIGEKMVLKTKDGRCAVQYVFSQDEGEEFLQRHGVNGLRVFPMTAVEYREWHEAMAKEMESDS